MNPGLQQTRNDSWVVWLLVSLALSLTILPLLEGFFSGKIALVLGFTATMIFGTFASRSILRIPALVLLFVALPMTWATLFIDSMLVFVTHCLLGSLFFWLVGGILVFIVVRTPSVSLNSVFGAISAYLLFGMAWANTYWAIYVISPLSLSFPGDKIVSDAQNVQLLDYSQLIYYSFVTMSTLGYGDITPDDRVTRTLSWIQSVTGQFYIAIVIAWLVSALPRPEQTNSED